MNINEVVKVENAIFYCVELDVYVRVVNLDSEKVIVSKHLDDFGDHSPLLEQKYSLIDILDMDFVEVKEYTLSEILNAKNNGKVFNIKGYTDSVYIENIFEGLPAAYIVGADIPLEESYHLRTVLDMKFMGVHSNERRV